MKLDVVNESTNVLVTKGTTKLMIVLNKERTIAKTAILTGHLKLFSNWKKFLVEEDMLNTPFSFLIPKKSCKHLAARSL